jgi:hypothetical protein
VQQSDQATGIANGLLIPNNLLIRPVALVLGTVFILLNAELLVCLTDGEHQEQGVGGAGDKCKQLWLVDAEDVVESQIRGQTELMDQRGHDLGVVLCCLSATRIYTCDETTHPEE